MLAQDAFLMDHDSSQPCVNHTLYKYIDFIRGLHLQRTQKHINIHARQIKYC